MTTETPVKRRSRPGLRTRARELAAHIATVQAALPAYQKLILPGDPELGRLYRQLDRMQMAVTQLQHQIVTKLLR